MEIYRPSQKFILNHRLNYILKFSKDQPDRLRMICDIVEEFHSKQDLQLRPAKIDYLKKFFLFLKERGVIVDIFDEESFDDYLANDFFVKNRF